MGEEQKSLSIIWISLVYLSWIGLTAGFRHFLRLFNYQIINAWIWAGVRMSLLLIITYLFVKCYEKKSFSDGFNFRFSQIGKNFLWAVIIFLLAGGVYMAYQNLIVKPIIGTEVIVSGASDKALTPRFIDRLIEYLYILFEGIIEVLIFIGFLVDRLAKKYGWIVAILLGNIGFALWHFSYWKRGFQEGTLMIVFTFIAGSLDSFVYYKTRNSLGPAIAHTLGDSPQAIRILLGFH